MISGPEGVLEVRYHSVLSDAKAPVAIIVPPHPEQEGSMDHPVIHTLFRTFASLGFNVLRFNFRGSGKSQGVFVHGDVEVSDAASCLDWLQSRNPSPSQCWVAGYSFGAHVALQLLMRRPECYSFVAVSPVPNLYDFNFLAPCPAPGLIVHGEIDEVTPKEAVARLVHQLVAQKRSPKVGLRIVSQADHSYSNQLKSLETVVSDYILADRAVAPAAEIVGGYR